ncbi:MAG: cupin domain-containing protein [Paracoccaceae bacterium]
MRRATITLAAALMAALQSTTPAQAGGCPEEHKLTEPRKLDRIGTKWLTREIIANVQLEGWREMGPFMLRQRRLELAPGGTVPTHSHADRPAIVYLAKGTVTEHNSFCAVPIVHHAGETSEEFGPGFVHYWENTGSETATFISTDVVPFPSGGTPKYGWEKGVSPDEQYGQ